MRQKLIFSMLAAGFLVFLFVLPSLSHAQTMSVTGYAEGADGSRLPGIDVMLWRKTEPAAWAFSGLAGVTGTDGEFDLSVNSPGEYRVEFSDPVGRHFREFFENASTVESATSFHINFGDHVVIAATLDVAASIRGFVASTLSPQAPVQNTYVYAWRQDGGTWILQDQSITSADGTFTISRLPEGEYRLRFAHMTAGSYFDLYYPSATSIDTASSIFLESGELHTGVNVLLTPMSQIEGIVAPLGGKPLSGLWVCLVHPEFTPNPLTETPETCLAETLTLENGQFSLPSLATGEYLLYFRDAFTPIRIRDGWFKGPGELASMAELATPIELGIGESRTLPSVQPEKAYSVYGDVYLPNGMPAPSAEVRIYRQHDSKLHWDFTTQSNSDGRILAEIPRDGRYSIGIFADGLAPRYHAATTTFADAAVVQVPTDTLGILLTEHLVLGGSVAGRVMDVQGGPMANIDIIAYLWDDELEESDNIRLPELLRIAHANSQGEYEVSGLGDEKVWLLFRDKTGALGDVWYPGVSAFSNAIAVQPIVGGTQLLENVTMENAPSAVNPAVHATGRVISSLDGTGVSNATVRLYGVPGWRPRINAQDYEPRTCPSLPSTGLTTPIGTSMTSSTGSSHPYGLGLFVPDQNPIMTGSDGHFGWQLSPGCWYLHVDAPGYVTTSSPVWGVVGNNDGAPRWLVSLAPLPTTPTPSPTSTPPITSPVTITNTPVVTHTDTPPSTPVPSPSQTLAPSVTPAGAATNTATVQATFTPVPTMTRPRATDVASTNTVTPSTEPPATVVVTPTMPTKTTPEATTPTPLPGAQTPQTTITPEGTPVTLFLYGILFADYNGNGLREPVEPGIAGATLELAAIDTSIVHEAESVIGGWRQSTTTSSIGGYAFRDVPVGDHSLEITLPEGVIARSSRRVALSVMQESGAEPLNLAVSAAYGWSFIPVVRH